MAHSSPSLTYSELDIKLDGNNYRDWSILVEIFDGFDFLSHIEDLDSTDEMKTLDCHVGDCHARVIITQSITTTIRSKMCTMRTAQAI